MMMMMMMMGETLSYDVHRCRELKILVSILGDEKGDGGV